MLRKILQTIGGIVLSIISIFFFYFALRSLNDGGNIFLFVCFFLGAVAAVFLFINATKDSKPLDFIFNRHKKQSGLIKKNNRLATDWDSTNETRLKLKLLKISTPGTDETGN